MPLFPTSDGGRISKDAAVATITAIATRIGLPTVCPSSHGQLFGGHSLRTGGAQTLAGLGVDPIRIQAMGRWKGSLVIRYSGNRGSYGITGDTVRGLTARASSSSAAPKPSLKSALQVDVSQHLDLEQRIALSLEHSHAAPPTYIINKSTGVIHKKGMDDRTICGMSYGRWTTDTMMTIPESTNYVFLCSRCCSHERNDLRTVGVVSSDSE